MKLIFIIFLSLYILCAINIFIILKFYNKALDLLIDMRDPRRRIGLVKQKKVVKYYNSLILLWPLIIFKEVKNDTKKKR